MKIGARVCRGRCPQRPASEVTNLKRNAEGGVPYELGLAL